jgi:hypothetical protein
MCLSTGCAELAAPVSERVDPSPVSVADSRLLSSDEHWAEVSDRADAFAGLYFNENGDLVIRLTRLRDSTVVIQAIGAEFESILSRTPKSGGKADIVFVLADKNFRELYAMKRDISDVHALGEGIVSVGIRKRTGQIVVKAIDVIRSKAEVLRSVPREWQRWLVVEQGKPHIPVQPQPTLFSRVRPLTGGYEAGPGACTMTIGARRGTDRLVLGSSHCSMVPFALDVGAMRQPNSGAGFGTEVTDPTSYSCGTFFQPRRCRRADVTAYSISSFPVDMFPSDTLDWRAGLIARTLFASPGFTQVDGSTSIDPLRPFFSVNAAVNWPVEGQVVHKIGWASGWTFGMVYDTCADVSLAGYGNIRIVCTDKAELIARGGDSGAPVFFPNFDTETATFYGIIVSSDGPTGAVFSNVTQIRQDLGPVSFF